MSDKASETKVYIKGANLNYIHLLAPKAGPNGGDPKYSVQIRIKKDAPDTKETMGQIKAAIETAYQQGVASKWGGKNPDLKACYGLVHDGDLKAKESGDVTYQGCWFLNANSKTAPQIITKNGTHLEQPGHEKEVYSGMIGTVSVNFYAYSGAKKGVACGLNNVLKTDDGTYAGGRESADADFAGQYDPAAPASDDPANDSNTTSVQPDPDSDTPW